MAHEQAAGGFEGGSFFLLMVNRNLRGKVLDEERSEVCTISGFGREQPLLHFKASKASIF